ncbi:hypothetical protein L204_105202 [Cryptococcus depauperatus]|nr:RNA-binding protein rnp24 [Cryptococcus depauperatus CBS 7855]
MSKESKIIKQKSKERADKRVDGKTKEAARKVAEAEAEDVVDDRVEDVVDDSAEDTVDNDRAKDKLPPKKRKRDSVVDGQEEELEIDVSAPAPLSKAEIRAARKKAKKGEAAVAPKRDYEKPLVNGQKKKELGEDKTDVEGCKKQHSVWIGNLAFKTTEETLKDFLEKGISELGEKGEGCVTRVNLPKKPKKGGFSENKGFAYVDFVTSEIQELAVQLSERPFDGRRLLIKKGDDHNPTPNARTPKPLSTKAEDLGSSSKRPETATLYMGNLPFDLTEESLRDLIEENASETESKGDEEAEEEIGPRGGKKSGLKKVRLAQFEDTGRCKGFAFLDFISSRHAKVALAIRKNHFYNGRRLTLEFASENAAKRSGAGKSKPESKTKAKNHYPKHNNAYDGPADSVTEAFKQEAEEESTRASSGDKRGRKWEVSGRPRPGAALAMAKREQVGIVEATGTKVTFD